MTDPNSDWAAFGKMSLDSDHAKNIQKVLDTATFTHLSAEAVQIRNARDKTSDQNYQKDLTCTISPDRFSNGQYNVVFLLKFSDFTYWIARVRLPSFAHSDSSSDSDNKSEKILTTEQYMLSEVVTMHLVRAKTTIPVPEVYHACTTLPNNFGYRYLLMEFLPGHHLAKPFSDSIPVNSQHAFLAQLASIYHQLSQLHFPTVGLLASVSTTIPGMPTSSASKDPNFRILSTAGTHQHTTSLSFFHTHLLTQQAIVQSLYPTPDHALASSTLLSALPSLIAPQWLHGPFPLCHVDLHYNNILVDDNYNITGVLDWSHAQTVPVEYFLVSPEWVIPPGISAERKGEMRAFRGLFAQAVRDVGMGREMADFVDDEGRVELVFRCMNEFPQRVVPYAKIVLRLLYGEEAKWGDFMGYFRGRKVRQLGLGEH